MHGSTSGTRPKSDSARGDLGRDEATRDRNEPDEDHRAPTRACSGPRCTSHREQARHERERSQPGGDEER